MQGREITQERFTDALRRHVGRGKELSVCQLSDQTGLSEKTCKNYHQGVSLPGLMEFTQLCTVLPAAFMHDCLACTGKFEQDTCLFELGSTSAEYNKALIDAMADGEISPAERSVLRQIKDKFVSVLGLSK